jgi:hypothetical protein
VIERFGGDYTRVVYWNCSLYYMHLALLFYFSILDCDNTVSFFWDARGGVAICLCEAGPRNEVTVCFVPLFEHAGHGALKQTTPCIKGQHLREGS